MLRAVPVGVGHSLPDRVVPNSYFEERLDTSDSWIQERTGIRRRHFAAPGELTSHLATRAARNALKDAQLEASEIDAIILATSTPDQTFPSTATRVQAELGAKKSFAFDLHAVCAGFVFALGNANALILSGQARRVLVIGSETFSRIMNWEDRTTCVLFGDGAGALVLEAQEGRGDNSRPGHTVVQAEFGWPLQPHSLRQWRGLVDQDDRVPGHGRSGGVQACGCEACRGCPRGPR